MIENVIVECTRKDKTFFKALMPVKIGDTLTLTNGYWNEPHEAVSMSHETIYGKEYAKVKLVGKLTQNIRTIYYDKEEN